MSVVKYAYSRVFSDPSNMNLYPSVAWKFEVDNGQVKVKAAICNPVHDNFCKKVARRILDNNPVIDFSFSRQSSEVGSVSDLVCDAVEVAEVLGSSLTEYRTLVSRMREIREEEEFNDTIFSHEFFEELMTKLEFGDYNKQRSVVAFG